LWHTEGMTSTEDFPRWVDERRMAQILGLTPSCLRNWRWLDNKEGRGNDPSRPGRGGLVWKRFNRTIRYLVTEDLRGPSQGRAA
jgi:hypothetical protein